ncbi:MAG TPA: glycoside hydrolase family 75 protein, partial [Chitinophagaceae bacterium]|nr:glycoside hydrolase family 75 protein [Chitinophagaceae bacterium]
FCKADFDLDADGSPCAYNESNTGLLDNVLGKNPDGKWFAVVTSDTAKMKPVRQDSGGVCPGYYISITRLELARFDEKDYRRYVHPDSICYFVLPGGKSGYEKMGIKVGDVGIVFNSRTQLHEYAIFADTGPVNVLGEGSMKLAKALQVPCRIDAKGRIKGGMDQAGIVYIILPKSGQKSYSALSDELIRQLVTRSLLSLNMSLDDLIKIAKGL